MRNGKASSMDVGKLARMMARRLLGSSSLSRQGFFGAGSAAPASGAACAWPLPLAAVVSVDEGWAVVVSASRCGARRVWMRASAYEHGSSGYHAGYDATGRVGWGVQRVGARALVRPLPPPTRAFHNRRKTWAVTKSEISNDTCPDRRIAAVFCTEFSLKLLRKWSVVTKNDETHDNNPSPSGAHQVRQCVIFSPVWAFYMSSRPLLSGQ